MKQQDTVTTKNLIQNFYLGLEKKIEESKHPIDINKALVLWYVETQYPDSQNSTWITDGSGDGEIDAIVKNLDGVYHVLQFKNNEKFNKKHVKCTSEKYEKFFKTVDIFRKRDKTEFKKWLNNNVRKEHHNLYTTVFDALKKDDSNVVFKFVTTLTAPTQLAKKFKKIGGGQNVDTLNTLLKIYNDSEASLTPEADPITLTWDDDDLFLAEDIRKNITSITARIHMKKIVDWLRQHPITRDRIIARNVRTRLDSRINDDILHTFEHSPDEFWYSHNGLTIICEEYDLNRGSHELTLKHPNVVNGAQTIMTLAVVEKPDPDAKVLVRIFVSEDIGEKQSGKLLDNIIFRTNQQNKLAWWQLKAHDARQIYLSREFGLCDVFYERRKNEAKHLKATGRFQSYSKLSMKELAALRVVAVMGTDGPVLARGTIDILFGDKYYQKLFPLSKFSDVFFEFCIYSLINEFYKKLPSGRDKNNVKMTIFAIFLTSIQKEPNLSAWKRKLKRDSGKFLSYKTSKKHRNQFHKLYKICKECLTTCKKIKTAEAKRRGEDLILRIYIKDKPINKLAINTCVSQYNTRIRRHMKTIFEGAK